MTARQGDEVGRPHAAAGLLAQPADGAGGRRPGHRIDRIGPPRREHRLDGDAGDVVGREREVHDRPNFVVVHTFRDGHCQRGEDPLSGEAPDCLRLHLAEILAAMEQMGVQAESVELEVDLDTIAHAFQLGQELVVAGDPDPVGVQDDTSDLALHSRLEDLGDLRVDRRLPAREHQRVDAAALALDRGVERSQDVRQSCVAVEPRAAVREAGGAVEVAVLRHVQQQDATVLRLEIAQAVEVAHRDGPDVVRDVGRDLAGGDPPRLEALPQRMVLLVQADDLTVATLAMAPQVDGAVHRHEVPLEDVRFVVDLAVRVVGKAAAADGQHHPEGQVRSEGEHQRGTNGRHRPATPTSRTTGTTSRITIAREKRDGSGRASLMTKSEMARPIPRAIVRTSWREKYKDWPDPR